MPEMMLFVKEDKVVGTSKVHSYDCDFKGEEVGFFKLASNDCHKLKELCPVFPGKYKVIHWGIEDPASAEGTETERMKDFRRVRQNILERINHFISDLCEE